ncbi:MAG: Dabb family protein [Suipraeoptans sp.]
MIKHLVFFKLAEEAEGNTKAKNMFLVKEMLVSLREVIPVIRKIAVFGNHPRASFGNYDVVLDSEFDSLEDLEVYVAHPEHQKVVAFITKGKTGRAAMDYEFSDIAYTFRRQKRTDSSAFAVYSLFLGNIDIVVFSLRAYNLFIRVLQMGAI